MSAPVVWWSTSPYLREPEPVKVVGETAQSLKVEYAATGMCRPITRLVRKESGGERYFKVWSDARDHMLRCEKQCLPGYMARVTACQNKISALEQLADPTKGCAS